MHLIGPCTSLCKSKRRAVLRDTILPQHKIYISACKPTSAVCIRCFSITGMENKITLVLIVDFAHALIPTGMERMSAPSEKDQAIFKRLRSVHTF